MTEQQSLIPREAAPVAVAPEPTTILAVISQAASNPDVDVDKMERLMAMYERMEENKAKVAFSEAMADVQKSIPQITKNAYNAQTKSKYAKHEAVAAALKPVYTGHGFSIEFSQGETDKPNHVRIVGVLRHAGGHEVTRWVDLPIDDRGIQGNANKTLVHATGSTFSYGRRYLTCMIFDAATGDDDDAQTQVRDEPITEAHLSELRDWMALTRRSETSICKWQKVEKLEHLSEAQFVVLQREFKKVVEKEGA